MLSAADRDRVEAAVRAAETGTAGEIVVVVARQASAYRSVPLLYGLAAALLVPPVLVWATVWPAARIFAAEAVVVALVLALSTLLGTRAVPHRIRRGRAAAAAREFVNRGLADTRGRTGVLLYVAVAERYAEVLGDVTIAGRVEPEAWRDVIEALVAAVGAGGIADALVAAIDRIGAILARHVPPGESGDELPNRVVLI